MHITTTLIIIHLTKITNTFYYNILKDKALIDSKSQKQ